MASNMNNNTTNTINMLEENIDIFSSIDDNIVNGVNNDMLQENMEIFGNMEESIVNGVNDNNTIHTITVEEDNFRVIKSVFNRNITLLESLNPKKIGIQNDFLNSKKSHLQHLIASKLQLLHAVKVQLTVKYS